MIVVDRFCLCIKELVPAPSHSRMLSVIYAKAGMLIPGLPSVTTWLPSSLASLILHCQPEYPSQGDDIYASFEEFQRFLAHDNDYLENLSVDCAGAYWSSQQHDALWSFLGPGTTWLQTLRVLNLTSQAVRYDLMEAFANASQMRELRLFRILLKNDFSREGWMVISSKMGARLKNLRLVTLVNITDIITLDSRTGESRLYLDNNSLRTICHNFLISVPSDRVADREVRDSGMISILKTGSSTR